MNKPQKVREIYAELRGVYGDEVPANELLECASMIVDASEPVVKAPVTQIDHWRKPFDELPVYEVMEQWAWRMMCSECGADEAYVEHAPEQLMLSQILEEAA
ncbi:MAG: hypothetical protein AAGI72_15595 [Pseudomonadota bacterium]